MHQRTSGGVLEASWCFPWLKLISRTSQFLLDQNAIAGSVNGVCQWFKLLPLIHVNCWYPDNTEWICFKELFLNRKGSFVPGSWRLMLPCVAVRVNGVSCDGWRRKPFGIQVDCWDCWGGTYSNRPRSGSCLEPHPLAFDQHYSLPGPWQHTNSSWEAVTKESASPLILNKSLEC